MGSALSPHAHMPILPPWPLGLAASHAACCRARQTAKGLLPRLDDWNMFRSLHIARSHRRAPFVGVCAMCYVQASEREESHPRLGYGLQHRRQRRSEPNVNARKSNHILQYIAGAPSAHLSRGYPPRRQSSLMRHAGPVSPSWCWTVSHGGRRPTESSGAKNQKSNHNPQSEKSLQHVRGLHSVRTHQQLRLPQ
jgi:hypothetical protein